LHSKYPALHRHRLTLIVALITAMLLTATTACGSSDSEEALFPKISDPGVVLTLDDVMATGYKKSSTYDTEGLPGATEVYFGFLRIGSGEPYDYEVRFYESHQAAIDQGTAMAEEGTGADAILSEDDATYKDGVKNRRMIIGGGAGGGARSGIGPKFGNYAIFGNVIMLCQGPDPEVSLERCGLMANALVPGE
jgi:hypothetical protein